MSSGNPLELRATTAGLHESERRYRSIVESAAEGIWVIDADNKTVFVNRQMATMLRTTVERMRGSGVLGYSSRYRQPGGILALVHPDDREAAASALASVIEGTGEPTAGVVLRILTSSGDYLYMECVGINLLEEPGIEAVVVTALARSERRETRMAVCYLDLDGFQRRQRWLRARHWRPAARSVGAQAPLGPSGQ